MYFNRQPLYFIPQPKPAEDYGLENSSYMKGDLILNIPGYMLRIAIIETVLIALFLGFIPRVTWSASDEPAKIIGQVVDKSNGESLIGVNVYLKETAFGSATDLNGGYRIIGIPAGSYTLIASMIGYTPMEVTELAVKAGEIVTLNISLEPEALGGSEEIVVEADIILNAEAALLRERQKAASVSDAISAEEISKAGSSDAADAVKRVTGASVVDDKYVYIRGLGERYISTQLNGAEIPSPDPNKKAVHMDMFPAAFLDNIVTTKSFTPDQPGNFAGGAVNLGTKKFLENFTMSFSASYGFNDRASFKDNALIFPGGLPNWLGLNGGNYKIPDNLAAPDVQIPDIGSSYNNAENALRLDAYSKAFVPDMAPRTGQGPFNQSYNFSIGKQIELFGRPLGLIGGVNYNRTYSYYNNGTIGRWLLTGNVNEVNDLTNDYLLRDEKGSDEVLWGGLFNLAYQFNANHEIEANYLHNHTGNALARYQMGPFPRDLAPNARYETRVLQFTEREIGSSQLKGKHYFAGLGDMQLEWTGTYTETFQDEPDLRYFTNNFTVRTLNGNVDTTYAIRPSLYPLPNRYFRELNENSVNFDMHLTVPFNQWSGLSSKVKFGGLYNDVDRTFRERRFEFRQDGSFRYDGNAQDFFLPDKVGIISEISGRYRFGNYVVDATEDRGNYDGDQRISAGFAMLDIPLHPALRFIGGVRYEATRMNVASHDELLQPGKIIADDWLPSANFVYSLTDNINMRAAYGRTLARPMLREMAPYASFDFVGDYIFIGNGRLKRTLIDNFDLRWEWFERVGEIYAISGFHKRFRNPIERVIVNINGEVKYDNVDEASVWGLEFEVRKRLDQVHRLLGNYHVGGNLSLVASNVDISAGELVIIRALDPNADDSRPLQGQSPYIANLEFGYDNIERGLSYGLFYNVFGERLSAVSLGGTPNVFEQPRSMLNFNMSKRIYKGLYAKFSGKNLLDSAIKHTHSFKGKEYTYMEYKLGRIYSVGFSYVID